MARANRAHHRAQPDPEACRKDGQRMRQPPHLRARCGTQGLEQSSRWPEAALLDCCGTEQGRRLCGIVSSALAAVSQPLCWIFGVHCIKHAVRLRCSCLWSTSRCAPQRRALQLHHAADGSGDGPLGVLNGTVAAGSSRSLPGFGLVRLCMAHGSYQQIWAEYRVSMCQCDLTV